MPENIRVEGVTTLQGRYTNARGISFDSIKNANDAITTTISWDSFGNPTRIEYTSAKISTIYKAVEVMTYDVAGKFETLTRSVVAI